MFKIEEKNYDLNFLFSFDMLKDILTRLLKNQKDLQNEINILKNSNKERDEKILNIEEIITEIQEEQNNDQKITPKKDILLEDNIEENLSKNEPNELNNKINNNNININNKTTDNININNNDHNEININENNNINEIVKDDKNLENNKEKIDEKEEKEQKEHKESININENKNEIINQNITDEKQNQKIILDKSNNKNDESPEINQIGKTKSPKRNSLHKISMQEQNKINSSIKEILTRINQFELKLNNIYSNKDLKNIKQELKNHNLENQSDFKVIEMRFNEVDQKFEDFDKKIEECLLKLASFDIINMIKDSGDGTVDGAKILFKSLEDKCNKKFELIDARYKNEALVMEKIKKNVENVMPRLDKVNRDIDQVKEIEEQQKEEIENTKKNIEIINENNLKLQKESSDDLINKIADLESELDEKLKKLQNDIKLNNKKEEERPLFNLHLEDNNEINKVDEERFLILEKKVSDLRTKLNDLNNTIKINANEEAQNIKNEIKEIKFRMETKIAKEDLKELYNMHLSDLDEINDLKDQISLINEEQKKLSKDFLHSSSRLETLNSNIIMLQNSQLNGGRGPVIDISRFIDQQKLSDILKPLIKEIEKLYKDLSSNQRELSEIKNYEKIFEKKDKINKLEEDIFIKLKDIENFNNKKFADKIETNKALKALDIQIKDLIGERKKTEGGDSWLMAKQPLKCFNCASCEANIKNSGTTQEYIPWNKYPQGERIYRMGQGFSHMLQMMTSEFVQTFEHNEKEGKDNFNNNNINLSIENESNNNNKSMNKVNTNSNINNNIFNTNEKSLIGARINNKDEFYRTGGRLKLPKMKKFSKYIKDKFDESIPVTDEEKDNIKLSGEKINKFNPESPKIMKIVKKKAKNLFNISGLTPKYGFSIDFGHSKNNIDKIK